MGNEPPPFRKPSILEEFFNKTFGFLVGLGLGFSHNYLVQVRGRKTGRVYSTPIDLLELDGRKYLVAPRGRAQWVRNAEAAGRVVLKRGRLQQTFVIHPLADVDKPRILKSYLDHFHREVQRYFPVPAGSDEQAFVPIAPSYPAFELTAACKAIMSSPKITAVRRRLTRSRSELVLSQAAAAETRNNTGVRPPGRRS